MGTRRPCQLDGARPRQVVREVHDQPVADLHPDHRARNRAVVGPGVHLQSGRDLDRRHPGLEVHLEDVGVGIAVHRLGHPYAGVPARRLQRLRAGRVRVQHGKCRQRGEQRARGRPCRPRYVSISIAAAAHPPRIVPSASASCRRRRGLCRGRDRKARRAGSRVDGCVHFADGGLRVTV